MSKRKMVNEGASTSKTIADGASTSNSIKMAKETGNDSNDKIANALQGWSKTEKLQLYKALKSYGSSDITNILCEVPTKSAIEIKYAILHYKSRIKITPVVETKERATKNLNKYSVPLTNWANLLTENLDFKDLHNEISEAIRIYADYGNIPPTHLTENVNFRDLYLLLADAMDGKPLTSYNNTYKHIIKECLVNASLFSSEFVKNSDFESIFQKIDIDECDASVFIKPTSDEELSCLRHLISQKKFNPFNLSEHDLKKALDVKNKNVT